jgi:hypothetical protein
MVNDELHWEILVSALKLLASSHRLSIAGARRVREFGKMNLFESEHAEMVGFLSHPRLVLDFK